jgi:hypothetical protein
MYETVAWGREGVESFQEDPMAKTLADMTADELRTIIEETIEGKLVELFGDPDEGMEVQSPMRERLLHQREAVVAGDRGEALEDVVRRLGFA